MQSKVSYRLASSSCCFGRQLRAMSRVHAAASRPVASTSSTHAGGAEEACCIDFEHQEVSSRPLASVSGAQDVNGDGLSDIPIGAPGSDTSADNAGAAYLFLGQPR